MLQKKQTATVLEPSRCEEDSQDDAGESATCSKLALERLLHRLRESAGCEPGSLLTRLFAMELGIQVCVDGWSISSIRPVLKHGPRSLALVRVLSCQTSVGNEGDC